MTSVTKEKDSSSKFAQVYNQEASKVRFDLEDSRYDNDIGESSDKNSLEFLPFLCDSSSSLVNSTMNGSTGSTKTVSTNEMRTKKKYYTK